MIQIKMFKANEGDAILVSFGENSDINIMIDMGPRSTYEEYIKPVLKDLKLNGKKLDLLVITHIDEDHIFGALEFMKENGIERRVIDVGEVWHNAYRHLQFDKEKVVKLSDKEKEKVDEIIVSNTPASDNKDGSIDISVNQGISLGGYLLKDNYNWNGYFNNNAVKCEEGIKEIDFMKGIKIILLSPNKDKLNKLSKIWLKELKDNYNLKNISDEEFWDDAYEYYMQYLKGDDCEASDIAYSKVTEKNIKKWALIEESDSSKPNGATISFIIEYKGDKLLFLGDAHENIIYESLKTLKDDCYELDFKVVKLAHHGSNKNISRRLIELINTRKYLISTDGIRHDHPDMEAISKILTKSTKKEKELIFNYEIDKIKSLIDSNLQNEFNYSVCFLNENDYITIN